MGPLQHPHVAAGALVRYFAFHALVQSRPSSKYRFSLEIPMPAASQPAASQPASQPASQQPACQPASQPASSQPGGSEKNHIFRRKFFLPKPSGITLGTCIASYGTTTTPPRGRGSSRSIFRSPRATNLSSQLEKSLFIRDSNASSQPVHTFQTARNKDLAKSSYFSKSSVHRRIREVK